MTEKKQTGFFQLLVIWLLALTVTTVAFYGLDHLSMSMQGLPLN